MGCGTPFEPEWYLKPPQDQNYLYAAATDTSTNMQFAVDKARNLAQEEIAGIVGTKVSSLFKRFREEVGEGESTEFLATTSAVSKQIVSEVISGCRIAKKEVKRKGNAYQAFVLMQMPVGEVNAALLARIKANQNMYARFRASQAFKELNEEVDKYEKFKKEQGM